ncbi:MAG TPA: hypothetical protein DCP90_04650 [Clostridiales bacterium]|nr:MAG: hypothetical protein A2Y22_06615 [Clostridiales bacterium GWD2_32_59]HAN09886.1 hypothetical protein [Clostridiales bacterium]
MYLPLKKYPEASEELRILLYEAGIAEQLVCPQVAYYFYCPEALALVAKLPNCTSNVAKEIINTATEFYRERSNYGPPNIVSYVKLLEEIVSQKHYFNADLASYVVTNLTNESVGCLNRFDISKPFKENLDFVKGSIEVMKAIQIQPFGSNEEIENVSKEIEKSGKLITATTDLLFEDIKRCYISFDDKQSGLSPFEIN